MEFIFDEDCNRMNQCNYLMRDLDKFQMSDCKSKSVPFNSSVNNEVFLDSEKLADAKLYREVVGSLIYAMMGTRPDICFIVTKLSKYMSNPSKADSSLAKYALRYLKGTLHYDLKFSKSDDEFKASVFCDSDKGSSSDIRSITGYCFQLYSKGSLISWKYVIFLSKINF
ncbi:uncharacterized protein [Palaemon carinicauda]|uniref:uncharacterized protein n=1 Tax=Palaemon carinicauda TaxID=392227 RepID=UPI0035B5DAFF